MAASRAAFGRPLTARPRLAAADVVLLLDADPLGPGPEQIANARAWSERRRGRLFGQRVTVVSGQSGEGLDDLWLRIARALVVRRADETESDADSDTDRREPAATFRHQNVPDQGAIT